MEGNFKKKKKQKSTLSGIKSRILTFKWNTVVSNGNHTGVGEAKGYPGSVSSDLKASFSSFRYTDAFSVAVVLRTRSRQQQEWPLSSPVMHRMKNLES